MVEIILFVSIFYNMRRHGKYVIALTALRLRQIN